MSSRTAAIGEEKKHDHEHDHDDDDSEVLAANGLRNLMKATHHKSNQAI